MPVAPFLIVVLIGIFTPGPNVVLSMNSARLSGVRATRPLMAGMSVGYGLIVFCASVFNIHLVRVVPTVRPYLGLLGATYLVWLAVKLFLPGKRGAGAASMGPRPFLTGVLLQFVNPKVVLNSIAVTASFILPYYDALPALAAFALGFGALCFLSLNCWALFGALFQRFFSSHDRALNVVMAGLLLYCAYSVSGVAALLG